MIDDNWVKNLKCLDFSIEIEAVLIKIDIK